MFCSDEDKASCEALKVALNSNYLDPITESGAGGRGGPVDMWWGRATAYNC